MPTVTPDQLELGDPVRVTRNDGEIVYGFHKDEHRLLAPSLTTHPSHWNQTVYAPPYNERDPQIEQVGLDVILAHFDGVKEAIDRFELSADSQLSRWDRALRARQLFMWDQIRTKLATDQDPSSYMPFLKGDHREPSPGTYV